MKLFCDLSYVQVILNLAKEEKTKLYEAIGYQENMEDPILPREVSVIKCVYD